MWYFPVIIARSGIINYQLLIYVSIGIFHSDVCTFFLIVLVFRCANFLIVLVFIFHRDVCTFGFT